MFSEMRQGQFQFVNPIAVWPLERREPAAIGVLDQDFEGQGFGLIVMARPPVSSGINGLIMFPRLAQTSFPVAIRSLYEEAHSPPALPNAASACWAEDRTTPGKWGLLTCRHALSGVAVGAQVTLSTGATARIDRKADPTIDAAFLTTTAPQNPTKMNLLRYPVPGQSVTVAASAGAAQRSVVTVTDTLGVINDPYHPIKVYLDQPCQPGDSGALVDSSANEGTGIYLGAMSNATVAGQSGQTVGFAQHLEQAIEILDLVPFV
jgi:hypothetical protein